jgi:Fe-S cluster assembly protein SufD
MTTLAAAAEPIELPTTDLEEWRYSRIGDIDLAAYAVEPSEVPPAPPAGLLEVRDVVPARAATVLVRNGRVLAIDVDEALAAAGLRVGRAAELPELADRVGVLSRGGDGFVSLNDELAEDPVVVDVPRGMVLEAPVVVASWIDGEGAGVFPRLAVHLGENSQATVLEWSGSADVEAMTVPVTELTVDRAARLSYVGVQDLAPTVNQIGRMVGTVGQEGTLRLGHVALGGDYARMRFDCRLEGRGATGDLAALYLGGGDQMHDLRTYQQHLAPDTTSDLLFKGALDDRAHAVYTGLIRIGHEGRGSQATQSNRIVKLSPEAWAESVPNLEIEHNDVRCSHASAVGPIDADQRFYLESRGVPPEATERLVVNGFFEEVLETLDGFGPGAGAVVERLRHRIGTRLGVQR